MGSTTSENMEIGSGAGAESGTGWVDSVNSDMETHSESANDQAICACRVGRLCNCRQSEKGRRVGYKYRYRFSTVEINEIDSDYKSVFEYRTNFFIIPIEEIPPIHIDSERFHCPYKDGGGREIDSGAFSRLRHYWMSGIQCFQLEFDARSFARKIAIATDRARVHVAVDLEVCTVQQEGEPLQACEDRAISAEKLAPVYLSTCASAGCSDRALHPELVEFLRELKRERVESIDEWGWPRNHRGQRFVMGACGVCWKSGSIGGEVSELPECKHVFHSHCVFRWLEKYNMCPTCRVPAYAVDAPTMTWL